LEVEFLSVGPELARGGIEFKLPEAQESPRISRNRHEGESRDQPAECNTRVNRPSSLFMTKGLIPGDKNVISV
jgi:hypothetical protein